MQESGVDWLVKRFMDKCVLTLEDIERAKEIEIEQRKKDYRAGWHDNKHKDWNCEFYLEKHLTNFETTKNEKI
jgi:hypothetical protein